MSLEIFEVTVLDQKLLVIGEMRGGRAHVNKEEAEKIMRVWRASDPGDAEDGGPYMREIGHVPAYGYITALADNNSLTLGAWTLTLDPRNKDEALYCIDSLESLLGIDYEVFSRMP